MKIIITSMGVIVVLALVAVWFGFYNIAANDKHFAITSGLLDVVRNRSIEARSSDINVPELNNKELIQKGALLYSQMCSGCHLAPGIAQSELNSGLYPQPPVFSSQNYKNKASAQFWVIKNGIKMTGMPAWSPPHTDDQLWSMVAFINKSKQLSAEQYQNLINQATDSHSESDDHSHNNIMIP